MTCPGIQYFVGRSRLSNRKFDPTHCEQRSHGIWAIKRSRLLVMIVVGWSLLKVLGCTCSRTPLVCTSYGRGSISFSHVVAFRKMDRSRNKWRSRNIYSGHIYGMTKFLDTTIRWPVCIQMRKLLLAPSSQSWDSESLAGVQVCSWENRQKARRIPGSGPAILP